MTERLVVSELRNNTEGTEALPYHSVFLLFLPFLLLFFLQTAYTSNVSAASITLSVPTTALSVDLDPNSNNGFAVSSAGAVSVKTDGGWGYNLGIRAKDSTTNKLTNIVTNSSLDPIPTDLGEAAFKSGAEYNNKWGYKPSKFNSNNNDNFKPGPTTNAILDNTTVANNSSPTSYNLTIAAKANNTLPPGTYTNTFILTATANTVSYNITYNLNSGSWSGANQSGTTTNRTITLDTHTPTRTNYEFKGWCNQSTTDETCSGTQYSVGGTYTLGSGSNTVTLHAMWKKINMEPAECQRLTTTGQTGTFTDPRDNNVYAIARLKDGKCWMTQNLRIVGKTISSSDSDMTSGSYTIPANDISKFNVGAAGSTSKPNNEAAYYGNNKTYGAWYTWQTATAGTGINMTNLDIASSICPKGWKLPTITYFTGDFYRLTNAYKGSASDGGSAALRASPYPNFSYAGRVDWDGVLENQGSYGYYWSSVASSDAGDAQLIILDNSAVSYGLSRRVFGYSVRCVARDT